MFGIIALYLDWRITPCVAVVAEVICLWPGAVIGVVANATSFRTLKKLLSPVVRDLGVVGPSALSGAVVELQACPAPNSIAFEPEFRAMLQLRTPITEFPVSRSILGVVLA